LIHEMTTAAKTTSEYKSRSAGTKRMNVE
jgi:hypothetical protein